jgi:phosphopantothenoylcysteine decarboxylase/phosphopantothenate--cysteine ligase
VIAPLSANTLSKIALGVCDNLLTTVVCALPKDTMVLLVPAMNENMWRNPSIQENAKRIKRIKKYIILDPQKGELACSRYGEGRMPEPRDIYKKIKEII